GREGVIVRIEQVKPFLRPLEFLDPTAQRGPDKWVADLRAERDEDSSIERPLVCRAHESIVADQRAETVGEDGVRLESLDEVEHAVAGVTLKTWVVGPLDDHARRPTQPIRNVEKAARSEKV